MKRSFKEIVDHVLELTEEETQRVFEFILASIESLPAEEQDLARDYIADRMASQEGVDSRFEAQFGIKLQ